MQGAPDLDKGIRCLADGEVVAYRIDGDYHDATPGAVGNGATLRPYSVGFVLVRHRLQAPTPAQPPKPPPMTRPGAEADDWGTWLYGDPQGRERIAWLRHGTPLIVEIGPYSPGENTSVRVVDTLDPKLPREAWVSRTWLAIDRAAGTGLRGWFGFKEIISTRVYRGDSIDPERTAAYAENQAERQRPPVPSAPVLTLYSLYMHVASEGDYRRHADWKRPAWWPERDGERKPDATDRIVVLPQPVPLRQGDVIAHIGEDVPAYAYPIAGTPVTRRLLHLEVFSGDDVPAYLTASRSWAKEHVPENERTLLLLLEGDTMERDTGGTVTVKQRQILRVAGLESRTVDGKRWRKVTLDTINGSATGWIEEDGRLVSPWEWPGFETHGEASTFDGFRHRDADAYARHLRGEEPRPPDSPFFQALHALIDRNGDGQLSEEELDRALRNRYLADRVSRLIVRHETEWTVANMQNHTNTVRRIVSQLGPISVETVNAEVRRGEKLPWWDEVATKAEDFPKSSRVWHFHPGGIAGNFAGCGCECVNVDSFIEKYRSDHGNFDGASGRKLDSVSELNLRDLLQGILDYNQKRNKACNIYEIAYMLATARHETLKAGIYFQPITESGPRSYFNKYDPVLASTEAARQNARMHENSQEGDGYAYRGRGYVQLTWRVNYRRCGDTLGIDLLREPDLALDKGIAAQIMCYGMEVGLFTGKKLADYISSSAQDYYNARKIINGLDRADHISGFAKRFEKLLEQSRCQ